MTFRRFSTSPIRLIAVLSTLATLPHAYAEDRLIDDFGPASQAAFQWSVVDDGVMGGLSKGKATFTAEGTLLFQGTLSLENNGGFSSIRSTTLDLDLRGFEGLALRVKGDGRTYQVRLSSEARYRGMEVSFMAEFATKKDEWVEVRVPFSTLKGSFRGTMLPEASFNPAKIERLGLLLGDNQEGAFALEVDWVHAFQKSDPR